MKHQQLMIITGLAVLGLFLAGCPDKPPAVPTVVQAPETTWVKATTPIRLFTTQPKNKDVIYLVDRSTDAVDTLGEGASGETTSVSLPAWDAVGTYTWKVAAAVKTNLALVSGWSEEHTIYVAPNNPPANLRLEAPMVAVKDVPAVFTVSATDPEGDRIQYYLDFGDGSKRWIDTLLPSGSALSVEHTYSAFDTVWVKAKARDAKRSECAFESTQVIIGAAGGVLWWAVPGGGSEDSEPVGTSPVIVTVGSDTLVISGGCDDYRIWAVKYRNGRNAGSGSSPNEENFGHPAYCKQTGHIICGNDDGELYALKATSLGKDWTYPNNSTPDGKGWGAPAIKGNRIYVAKDNDSLYCLEDAGSQPSRVGAYYSNLINIEVSYPIVANDGSVLLPTDNCYVMKFDANLTTKVWEKRLLTGEKDEIHGLALGDDGTIYATTNAGIFAINPADGEVKWSALTGVETWYTVVGSDKVYVTTGTSKIVALNPADGGIVWQFELKGDEINAGPVLTTKYIYALDEEDIVYCVDISGSAPVLLWKCDCPSQVRSYLPRRSRLTSSYNACLTIGPTGNLIAVGQDAMYCVAGYSDTELAPTRWPKWQRDPYNTGDYNSQWP